MNYIVVGEHEFFVNKAVDELLKNVLKEINDFNVVSYDYEESLISPIIDEAMSLGLGMDKKAIVIKRPTFLLASKVDDENIDELDKLLDNQDENISLIFKLIAKDSKVIVKSSKIAAKVLETSTIVEAKKVSDEQWPSLIKRTFDNRGVKISDEAFKEFLDRCGKNLVRIKNEVEKLSSYSKEITKDDIETLVDKPLEDKTFEIIDALIKKRADIAIEGIRELKQQNKDLIPLIPTIAKQVRFMYQVKYLLGIGKRKDDINQILNITNPYRVNIVANKIASISEDDLLNLLAYLEGLDDNLKSGIIDPNILVELLCIEPLRKKD